LSLFGNARDPHNSAVAVVRRVELAIGSTEERTIVRVVEHRRHSMRNKPGQHLSQPGVELARRVGEGLGAFDRVVTSRVPRAFETALAMGYAVDEQLEELSGTPEGLDAELDWRDGCSAFQRAARAGGVAARYVAQQAALMRAIATKLPEGGRALVISHGGIVEAGVVGCRPDEDFTAWGPSCGFCEGVRLTFEGDRCAAAALLRVPGSALEN
jgi:broad specificity phosphatase PhoE